MGVERGGSVFRLRVIETIGLVFVAVVGSQVEVRNDLYLLGEKFEHILLKQEISHLKDGIEIELRPEVMEDVSPRRSVFAVLAKCRNGGPVGARADEDLKDIVGVDLGVLAEI